MIAAELDLGPVLRWSITSSTQLIDGLYQYDAISWVQEQNTHRQEGPEAAQRIGQFIRLGPVGTALLPWERPRVLLIDEIDKADIDLPNDLLHVFEEGEFEIPELFRLDDRVRDAIDVYTSDHGQRGENDKLRIPMRKVHDGVVRCHEFPIVVLTSNGERSFPPAFLRRCLRLHLVLPDSKQLMKIVRARIPELAEDGRLNSTLDRFVQAVERNESVAIDQLLHAAFLISAPERPSKEDIDLIQQRLMGKLDE
jgi:MoxR-like ATPase